MVAFIQNSGTSTTYAGCGSCNCPTGECHGRRCIYISAPVNYADNYGEVDPVSKELERALAKPRHVMWPDAAAVYDDRQPAPTLPHVPRHRWREYACRRA